MPKDKLQKLSDELVRYTLLHLCQTAGLEKNVKPEAVAQNLRPEAWQKLTKRVRLMAKQLAEKELIEILRKGDPVDPEEAKGLIRLRITETGLKEKLIDPRTIRKEKPAAKPKTKLKAKPYPKKK